MASRSVQWRRKKPEVVEARTEEALEKTLYIVHEAGPTSFVLKEEGREKKFKTCLGSPHQCSCSVFRREGEVCIHILWLLLRRFRLSKESLLSFQLGLVEREINELLYNSHTHQRGGGGGDLDQPLSSVDTPSTIVERRAIAVDDVCPICQEPFSARPLAITFCKLSCGQNIHVRCMKIWADHQVDSEGSPSVQCPVCRGQFLPLKELCGSDLCAYKAISGTGETAVPVSGGHKVRDKAERLISKLRAFPVGERARRGGGGCVCEMCGEVTKRGDWLRKLPSCGHKFHRECIDGWLRSGHAAVCPLDATRILPPSVAKKPTHNTDNDDGGDGGEFKDREKRMRRRRQRGKMAHLSLSGQSLLPQINMGSSCNVVGVNTAKTAAVCLKEERAIGGEQRSHDRSHDLPSLPPLSGINLSPSHLSHPHRVTRRKWPPPYSTIKKGLVSSSSSSSSLSQSHGSFRRGGHQLLLNPLTIETTGLLVSTRCSLPPSTHSLTLPPPLLPPPPRSNKHTINYS